MLSFQVLGLGKASLLRLQGWGTRLKRIDQKNKQKQRQEKWQELVKSVKDGVPNAASSVMDSCKSLCGGNARGDDMKKIGCKTTCGRQCIFKGGSLIRN